MGNSIIEIVDQNRETIINDVIDALFGGPTDKLKLINKKLASEGRISDLLYLNNLEMFLKNANFDKARLRKFSEKLEEHGNKKSYAIALLKAIDDVDSEEKARCLANLTQSVVWSEISIEKYLRLVHTLRQLVEEDLEFLSSNISKGKFLDNEYLDDYIAFGIIREVEGGFVYTKKAWELLKYGICRGHDIKIPEKIESRSIISYGLELGG